MAVRWTRQALADLDNILSHAAKRGALEATNIRQRVQRAVQTIETFPRAAFHNRAKDYFEKVVPRTRVILIYRLLQGDIVIFAAFHSSRSPRRKP